MSNEEEVGETGGREKDEASPERRKLQVEASLLSFYRRDGGAAAVMRQILLATLGWKETPSLRTEPGHAGRMESTGWDRAQTHTT